MDEWEPITDDELEEEIVREMESMASADAHRLSNMRTFPVRRMPCRRPNSDVVDYIPVIATINGKLLIYDDVEDGFGVASQPITSPLTNWDIYGPLHAAFRALFQGGNFSAGNRFRDS